MEEAIRRLMREMAAGAVDAAASLTAAGLHVDVGDLEVEVRLVGDGSGPSTQAALAIRLESAPAVPALRPAQAAS